MSERWSPKKLRRDRTIAIARGVPASSDPTQHAAQTPAPKLPPDLLCRAHDQPWQSCEECGTVRVKKS